MTEYASKLLPPAAFSNTDVFPPFLLSHLQYVDENVLFWLLGATDVLQDHGVVDPRGVRLV